MTHTFANLLTHVVFSTKDRERLIAPRLKPDLLAYMGGIIREMGGKAIISNSMPDHVHILLSLPPSVPIADVLRVVKTNSSRWVHQTSRRNHSFGWQTGYGAFSVSESKVTSVARYIREQEEHHRRISFQEEFVSFLKKNGIKYDERYIWE